MTNYELIRSMNKEDITRFILDLIYCDCGHCPAREFCNNTDVHGCDNAFMEWLNSPCSKNPLLTPKEKEYLGAFINPFKKDIWSIRKASNDTHECIRILFKEKQGNYHPEIILPEFDKGKMYKGMARNREYTLKELELD